MEVLAEHPGNMSVIQTNSASPTIDGLLTAVADPAPEYRLHSEPQSIAVTPNNDTTPAASDPSFKCESSPAAVPPNNETAPITSDRGLKCDFSPASVPIEFSPSAVPDGKRIMSAILSEEAMTCKPSNELSYSALDTESSRLTSTPITMDPAVPKPHNEYPLLHFRQLLVDGEDSAICLVADQAQDSKDAEAASCPPLSGTKPLVTSHKVTEVPQQSVNIYSGKDKLGCCDSTVDSSNVMFSSIDLGRGDSVISSTGVTEEVLYDVLMQASVDMEDVISEESEIEDSTSETSTAYSSDDEESVSSYPNHGSRYTSLSSMMNTSLAESTACLSLREINSQRQIVSQHHPSSGELVTHSESVGDTMAFGSASLSRADQMEPVSSSTTKPAKSQSLVWQKEGCFVSPPKMDIVALATSCTLSGSLYDQDQSGAFTDDLQMDRADEERELSSSSYSVYYTEDRYGADHQYVNEYNDSQYNPEIQPGGGEPCSESKLMDLATACTTFSAKEPEMKSAKSWSAGAIGSTEQAAGHMESSDDTSQAPVLLVKNDCTPTNTPGKIEDFSTYVPKVTYVINNDLEAGSRIDNVPPVAMVSNDGTAQALYKPESEHSQQRQPCVKMQLINKVNRLETRLTKLMCYPVIAAPLQQLYDIYKQRLVDIEIQKQRWQAQKPQGQSSQRMMQSFYDKELEVLVNFIEIELENVIARRSVGPVTGFSVLPQQLHGLPSGYQHLGQKPAERDAWGGKLCPELPMVRKDAGCTCAACSIRPIQSMGPMAPAQPHSRPLSVDVQSRNYGPYGHAVHQGAHYAAGLIPVVSSSPRIQRMEVDSQSVGGYHVLPNATVPSTFFTPPPSPLTSPQDITAQRTSYHTSYHTAESYSFVEADKQATSDGVKWSHRPSHSPGIPWYPRVHLASGSRAEKPGMPIFAVPTLPSHCHQMAYSNSSYRMPLSTKPAAGQGIQLHTPTRGPQPKVKTEVLSQKNKAHLKAVQLNRQLNPLAIGIMDKWYKANIHHPYPSLETVEYFVHAGNVTPDQVKKWFANKRMRSGNTKTLHELAILRRQFSKDAGITEGGVKNEAGELVAL